MDKKMKDLISKELEQFHCSVLLDEVKEKVRKLRAYGVQDADIEAALHEEKGLPRLVVTKDYRIVIAGRKQREVKMEPLVKAVYLLFLAHPEGILFKRLPDYREELTRIYVKLRPTGLTDRVLRSIEDVTNPILNSINEKCARIRSAFIREFDESLAKNYFVTGERGDPKKISLPRDLVVWE
jgi:hypothetical protein